MESESRCCDNVKRSCTRCLYESRPYWLWCRSCWLVVSSGSCCFMINKFLIQYLKYNISLIKSLLNSFFFVVCVGGFYLLFKEIELW